MKFQFPLAVGLLLCSVGRSWAYPPQVDRLLDAMTQVESGGNNRAVGDGGQARGPLQIHRAYCKDTGGDYSRCWEPEYSREIVVKYWERYCPKALSKGDLETLARTHNGGPQGGHSMRTLKYWWRVQAELEN